MTSREKLSKIHNVQLSKIHWVQFSYATHPSTPMKTFYLLFFLKPSIITIPFNLPWTNKSVECTHCKMYGTEWWWMESKLSGNPAKLFTEKQSYIWKSNNNVQSDLWGWKKSHHHIYIYLSSILPPEVFNSNSINFMSVVFCEWLFDSIVT